MNPHVRRPQPLPADHPGTPAPRLLTLTIDGQVAQVREGTSLLKVLQSLGIDTPTLCWAENLTPVNVCRICVVELEGARTLVPSCSRAAEDGMVVHSDSPRVQAARRTVLELLASSVDTSTAPQMLAFMARYAADGQRFGPAQAPLAAGERDRALAGHHHLGDGQSAATVAQPVKIDNSLYVRDYAKCILCYKCVESCGIDAQASFAIAVAGRGFDARISTEHAVPLPESACVYCGTCVDACPTGALMFKSEHDLRQAGQWRPADQATTRTICPFCGVGCTLELTSQDNKIVRVTSPKDSPVSAGALCVKGRFGTVFVHGVAGEEGDEPSSTVP